MKVNSTVIFHNNSRLFLLGEILQTSLYQEVVKLFNEYQPGHADWQDTPEFAHYPGRLVYSGSSSVIEKINQLVESAEFNNQLNSILGLSLKCHGTGLWLDLPGYKIPPHSDTMLFDYGLQIYVPDETNFFQMLGTCFYHNDPKFIKPMFEIHYMPNTGYFIDKTHSITHGLHHGIPPNYRRQSVYIRYHTA